MQAITYKITKTFINGLFNGLTIEETTTVKFEVGFVCKKPIGGSGYRIDAVEIVG